MKKKTKTETWATYIDERLNSMSSEISRLKAKSMCKHKRLSVDIDSDGWISDAVCKNCGKNMRSGTFMFSAKRVFSHLKKLSRE